MLRNTLSSGPGHFMKEVTRCVAGRNESSPLIYYEPVRSKRTDSTANHAHVTYSNLGNLQPRKTLVDPKLLKKGHPVSSTLQMGDMVKARKFEFNMQALNARGFLRFQKAYTPPKDADEKIVALCRECLDAKVDTGKLMNLSLSDSKQKYELLARACEEFQHGVPNSLLHMMNTVGDLVEFYCTKVNTNTPYEEMLRNADSLPQNLHIQAQPIRFHPDTDSMFGGQTAFTKRSTIVTGLRAKKKYRGYEAKMTWP